jgi:hypothetical protein
MKLWRLEAREHNAQRRAILAYNEHAPRRDWLPVPPSAKIATRLRVQWQNQTRKMGIKTTWLLAGLMERAGMNPPSPEGAVV